MAEGPGPCPVVVLPLWLILWGGRRLLRLCDIAVAFCERTGMVTAHPVSDAAPCRCRCVVNRLK